MAIFHWLVNDGWLTRSDMDILHSRLRMADRRERRLFRRRRNKELKQEVAELKATVFALLRALAAAGHLTPAQMIDVLHQPPPVLDPLPARPDSPRPDSARPEEA